MTGRAPGSGRVTKYYPLRPREMAATCRKLAADLRREAALGWGPVPMTSNGNNVYRLGISRAEAAVRMDEQAERWQHEAKTGERNEVDRARIGW
jgi:hypothetical protein